MTRFARVRKLTLLSPTVTFAGIAEDANAVIDRWSAAYSGNDPENIAGNYWPDAILPLQSGRPHVRLRRHRKGFKHMEANKHLGKIVVTL